MSKTGRKWPLSVRIGAHRRRIVLKLAALTIGAAYTSAWAKRLRRWHDRATPAAPSRCTAAVAAHVFYPEVLGEILECHATLPPGSDLILTAPSDRLTAIERKLAGRTDVRLVEVPNRGRDIAPFLSLLNAGDLDRYDAVLKVHTKRSPHLLDGDTRRKLLYTMLAGSRQRTNRILALFEDAATGLVGWKTSWRTSPYNFAGNYDRIAELAVAMGAATPQSPAFFEGTMFWVRPKSLARLEGLRLEPPLFEAEAGQLDETLHHALERCFTIAAVGEGYTVRSTRGELLYPR